MVPMFRVGLGPFVGNPLTGYIMVLKIAGRKSGKVRFSPVNYAIENGNIFCMAGWRRLTDWDRNMVVTSQVEVILPGGKVSGKADEVLEPEERRVILRKILKNAGFAGFLVGFNPYTVSDEVMLRKTFEIPLRRIHPDGIENGPFDPGGLAWVWALILMNLGILIIVAIFR